MGSLYKHRVLLQMLCPISPWYWLPGHIVLIKSHVADDATCRTRVCSMSYAQRLELIASAFRKQGVVDFVTESN